MANIVGQKNGQSAPAGRDRHAGPVRGNGKHLRDVHQLLSKTRQPAAESPQTTENQSGSAAAVNRIENAMQAIPVPDDFINF